MQSPLADLLNKEMDRKDFLKHVAVGVVALTGASTIVRTISQSMSGGSQSSVGSKASAAYGYGASAYGGGSDGSSQSVRTVKSISL